MYEISISIALLTLKITSKLAFMFLVLKVIHYDIKMS